MTQSSNLPRDTPAPEAVVSSKFKLPIRVTKSDVHYEVFDYTTSFTSDRVGYNLECQPTVKLEIENNSITNIIISLEGQLRAEISNLDFKLIQKMRVNRHWESFSQIDPALKKVLYKDVMNSFTSKFNLLFPEIKIKVVETETAYHIAQEN